MGKRKKPFILCLEFFLFAEISAIIFCKTLDLNFEMLFIICIHEMKYEISVENLLSLLSFSLFWCFSSVLIKTSTIFSRILKRFFSFYLKCVSCYMQKWKFDDTLNKEKNFENSLLISSWDFIECRKVWNFRIWIFILLWCWLLVTHKCWAFVFWLKIFSMCAGDSCEGPISFEKLRQG